MISVIIPAYNAYRTIGETIDSITQQILQPDEIVLVDDGSTDGTAKHPALDLPHLRIIRQDNGGGDSDDKHGKCGTKRPILRIIEALLDRGRDHNHRGFSFWMAGGGVKGGFRYGATDEYGYYAVEDRMHVHDFHATLLHLLGLNHKKLTYRYAGRDFRLTDVHGEVAHKIMA